MKKNNYYSILQGFLLGACAIFAFMSCEKDDDEATFEPTIYLETEEQVVSNSGSEYQLEVLSNQAWEVSADVDWIQFEETSGEKGKFWISYAVVPNEDDERTGVISISGSQGGAKEVLVVQEAGNLDDIYVTKDGTGEGFSWEDATNIETALEMAVTGNTIHIAAGTYTPSITVRGGDSSDERDLTFEVRNNISLVGGYPASPQDDDVPKPEEHASILSGTGQSYHVVTVSAPKAEGEKVVLQSLEIREGMAGTSTTPVNINGTEFRRDYGGGLIVGNAVLEIIDSKIVDNTSEKFAAGIYAFGETALTIMGTKVSNNSSTSNAGGIWVASSVAHIYGSEFSGNSGGTASGVHAYPDAELYMYNSVVANNQGRSFGPGVYIRQNSKAAIVNSVIYGNSSIGQHAGGVMMYNNNELVIMNSTITQNQANGSGGGVMKQSNNNTLHIYNSIISGNEQASGGDLGQNDDGPEPYIYASVIGDQVYDLNQNLLEDASFNPAAHLRNGSEGVYLPVGDGNPALELGMGTEALTTLAVEQEPALDTELIILDFFHNSREGLQVMGAFVGEDQ